MKKSNTPKSKYQKKLSFVMTSSIFLILLLAFLILSISYMSNSFASQKYMVASTAKAKASTPLPGKPSPSPSSIANSNSTSFTPLSTDLATFLTSKGTDTGVVVLDLTHQHTYTYNSNNTFIAASSIKVPIMLAFLDMVPSPNDDQVANLTKMIENSDNDAASDFYYNQIGGATGLQQFLQKIGISGINPDPDAWGYSQVTPQAMVDLLALLHNGKILSPENRSLALTLMANVESDQQIGVGDTAPNNAKVEMKDGWVTDDNDLWAMNSSGIVTTDKTTYIISVYTQNQQTLEDGQTFTQHVCLSVASLLG